VIWHRTACVFYRDVKLWVAVQVATCRGRGHIVSAALQTAQLV